MTTTKEKKPAGETREVQVTARKIEDKSSGQMQGGLSTVRREMLQAIRAEEDEEWEDLEFCDITVCNPNLPKDTLPEFSNRRLSQRKLLRLFSLIATTY